MALLSLDGKPITDAYLRNLLLNNGELDTTDSRANGLDSRLHECEDNSNMKKFLLKFFPHDKDINIADVLTSFSKIFTNTNIDLFSSILLFDKNHLLTVLYLYYEGRLDEDGIISLISSSSSKTRAEILLSILNSNNEKTEVDLFAPLKKRIARKVNILNPTEVDISTAKKLREETKWKCLNLKTQYLSSGNLKYADWGKDSPLYKRPMNNVASDFNYLAHNVFNIGMLDTIDEFSSDTINTIESYYKKYAASSSDPVDFERYKTDIKNGIRLRNYIDTTIKPDEYLDTGIDIVLNNVFASTLWKTLKSLVDYDWKNRCNMSFIPETYPSFNELISRSLQEDFNNTLEDFNNTLNANLVNLSKYIRIESLSQRNDQLQKKQKYQPKYDFDTSVEKEYDQYMKIDLLCDECDDSYRIINFGHIPIYNYINKIGQELMRNCGLENLTMDYLISYGLDGEFESTLLDKLEAINFTYISSAENFLFRISKEIVKNYIEYLFDMGLNENDIDSVFRISQEEFNFYENIFKIRHRVLRFNQAVLAIKNTKLYQKIMTDPCNCNTFFDQMSSFAEYLKYNNYFQIKLNMDKKVTTEYISRFKTYIDGTGGIL